MGSKVLKKIVLAMLLIFILLSLHSNVQALSLSEMQTKANNFIEAGSGTSIDYEKVTDEFEDLAQILTMIGIGVMVGVTTYMGIKYLTAGPEAQAKLKVQLIGVVVSGVVIFAAFSIWKLVLQIVSKF